MGALMAVAPTDTPTWPIPPEGGWTAEHLDQLPNLPPHTELLDGSLVFMSPQRNFHIYAIRLLEYGLLSARPSEFAIIREMTVTLGRRDRPEPDLMVVPKTAVLDESQTDYRPADVLLAVEVVSPDSEERDREVKPRKYAAAGFPHYWRVENEKGRLAVHVFERDAATAQYAPLGVFRDRLVLTRPFPLEIDLSDPEKWL